MKFKLLIAGVFLLGAGWYYFSPPSAEQVVEGENVKRIIERGVLLVGTDATYPPMEDVLDSGVIVGLDIDVAAEISKNLGVELEVIHYDWSEIFAVLDDGEIDMILSSVTVNNERSAKWLFSSPYLSAGQVILAKKGKVDIKTAEDLGNIKVAVVDDTTSYAEALKYVLPENIITYDTFHNIMNDFESDEFGATIVDLPVAVEIVKNNMSYEIYGEPVTQEFYGVVMRKGENDLAYFVNNTLALMKRDGRLQKIKNNWLK